jgi:ubiquinol-cytochrome c reductase iron-sulfur subunit
MVNPTKQPLSDPEPTTRRDILYIIAGTTGVMAAAAGLRPLAENVGGLNLTPFDPFEHPRVDLAPIAEGASVRVIWRRQTVLVRHRTQREIAAARTVDLKGLPDALARNPQLPADAPAHDVNRTKPGHERWLVILGMCPHLGCVVGPGGDYGGWICPCHTAHFDSSGRVRAGPPRRNLGIPPYRFVTDTLIEIG